MAIYSINDPLKYNNSFIFIHLKKYIKYGFLKPST